jgi:hypothetical protein
MAWLGENGIETSGLELDSAGKAKTVRLRDGEALITDGPYVETKEQIAGFFLVELDDLDQAIEFASRVPLAQKGSVEIRPVVDS